MDAIDRMLERSEARPDPSGRVLTALGSCVFAGAFSLGAEAAGFSVLGHLERQDLALGSRVASGRWPVLLGGDDEWRGAAARLGGHVDVLYANPPCSAYAQNGLRRGLEDPVMKYLGQCKDLALAIRPKAWVWELVCGIYERDLPFIDAMAHEFATAGYAVWPFHTSSALHGGFQDRHRFHFIACVHDVDFDGVYASEPPERRGWRTLGEALDEVHAADLAARSAGAALPNHEPLESDTAVGRLIRFCPPGGYLNDINTPVLQEYYRPWGRPWDGTGKPGTARCRGRRDRWCPTIVGGPSVAHPDEDRWLTVREAAHVQGYPMDFEFSSGAEGHAEVGKGLCVPNARFVMRAVHQALTAGVQAEPGLRPLVDWRPRAVTPTLSCTDEERRAWWRVHHPGLPPEWAERRRADTIVSRPRRPGPSDGPDGSTRADAQDLSCESGRWTRARRIWLSAPPDVAATLERLGVATQGLGEPVARLVRADTLRELLAALASGSKFLSLGPNIDPSLLPDGVGSLTGSAWCQAISLARLAGLDPRPLLVGALRVVDDGVVWASLLEMRPGEADGLDGSASFDAIPSDGTAPLGGSALEA